MNCPPLRSTLVCAIGLALAATASAQDETLGWPREIDDARAKIVLYQPQIEALVEDRLTARAAVSVTEAGKTSPVFGAVWLESRIETDRDERTVTILETEVPQVRFPDASDEQQAALQQILVEDLSAQQLEFSLDRLLTALDLAEHERDAVSDFHDEPPTIRFADYPAILVTIDGEPQLRDIEGHAGMRRVVNTAFLIVLGTRDYYLYSGQGTWYASRQINGPWVPTQGVPASIAALAPVEAEQQAREAAEAAMEESGEDPDLGPDTPPAIIVVHEPTELIVTDGEPEYEPVGTGLLYVANTESDVLMEIETQRHFVLLAGRWFAGEGLEGPWSFTPSDGLPTSFAEIPDDSDVGHLRVWIAGTDEAKEAVLDASIPQTSAIPRDATIEVTYDGNPRFEDIDGTGLQYATNTAEQVIKDGAKHYCAKDGVWYVADHPYGPWAVATEVPEEIREIPPSSPVYNTKYVYIYESTPEVVYVGYYPGYTHSYVYHGAIVYGTGWYYRPWWGTYYYPRATTYGFHVRWNPWYGWSFGFSYSTGRFTFGIGFGGWGRGYWGPVGYRPYYRGYARGWHHGYRRGVRAGYAMGRLDNRYRAQNLYRRNNVAGGGARPGNRPTTRPSTTARPATGRANNMYADRSGNVHQRSQDGQWQQRSGATTRGGSSQTQLNQHYQARQNGAARTQSYQRSRGGGGARRGGGRRR